MIRANWVPVNKDKYDPTKGNYAYVWIMQPERLNMSQDYKYSSKILLQNGYLRSNKG